MSLEMKPEVQRVIGDQEKHCSLNRFWIPILMQSYSHDKKYTWINDQMSSNRSLIAVEKFGKWSVSQPNGIGLQKCVERRLIEGEYLLLDINCKRKYCTICNIPTLVFQLEDTVRLFGTLLLLDPILFQKSEPCLIIGSVCQNGALLGTSL